MILRIRVVESFSPLVYDKEYCFILALKLLASLFRKIWRIHIPAAKTFLVRVPDSMGATVRPAVLLSRCPAVLLSVHLSPIFSQRFRDCNDTKLSKEKCRQFTEHRMYKEYILYKQCILYTDYLLYTKYILYCTVINTG